MLLHGVRSFWRERVPRYDLDRKKSKHRDRRLLQLATREADRLGLRGGQITLVSVMVAHPIILHRWDAHCQLWFYNHTFRYDTTAVWKCNQTGRTINLKTFATHSHYWGGTQVKNVSNLIYRLVRSHESIRLNLAELKKESASEHELAIRLVALVADHLRIDHYDDMKRFVVFGKVSEIHSLNILRAEGLIWDDETVPEEVREYFLERHRFNPVSQE